MIIDVVIPQMQNCCGALHAHSGEKDTAKELAKKILSPLKKETLIILFLMQGGVGLFSLNTITC